MSVCPLSCDTDCDSACHESHLPAWRRDPHHRHTELVGWLDQWGDNGGPSQAHRRRGSWTRGLLMEEQLCPECVPVYRFVQAAS